MSYLIKGGGGFSMSNLPLISVIIVNFNGRDFISDCLDSVLSSDYPNFEVILIDNASTDGSFNFIKNKYKKINNLCIFESKVQLFFTGGCNLGSFKSKGEKLVFLNSDTVVNKNWLKELFKLIIDKPNYLVQPKILLFTKKDTIDNAGGKYSLLGYGTGIGRGSLDNGRFDKNYEIDYVNGTAFMIDKKFFNKLGKFDELYKYQYEDVDLCLRARKFGGKCWYCYKSVIYHKDSLTFKKNVSSEDLMYRIRLNKFRTIIKNFSGIEKHLRLSLLLSALSFLCLKELLTTKRSNLSINLKVIKEIFINRQVNLPY